MFLSTCVSVTKMCLFLTAFDVSHVVSIFVVLKPNVNNLSKLITCEVKICSFNQLLDMHVYSIIIANYRLTDYTQ